MDVDTGRRCPAGAYPIGALISGAGGVVGGGRVGTEFGGGVEVVGPAANWPPKGDSGTGGAVTVGVGGAPDAAEGPDSGPTAVGSTSPGGAGGAN